MVILSLGSFVSSLKIRSSNWGFNTGLQSVKKDECLEFKLNSTIPLVIQLNSKFETVIFCNKYRMMLQIKS